MKKWMRIMMALVFVSSILMMGAAWAQAAGGITDDSGNPYTNLHTAFSAVPDGETVTFTITGEVYASTGNNGMAELTRNASVTLLAGSSDAVIRGNIISSGGGTLTFGSGDTGNPLLLKGRIIVSSGTLITNSEFRAENGYSVTATYNDTICLGGIGATGKVTAYINGGSFYNGNTTAIFAAGKNVTLAHIKDAEIISANNSDGTVNATDGAKIERIENCVIRGKSYGIQLTRGGYIGQILATAGKTAEITAEETAIGLVKGDAERPTRIESIKNVTITNTGAGNGSNTSPTSAIRMDNPNGGVLSIGTIDGCTITCSGKSQWNAGIQLLGTSGTPLLRVEKITNCTIRSLNGADGIYAQNSVQIGDLTGNDVQVNVDLPTGAGKAVELLYSATIDKIEGGKYVSLGTSVSSYGIRAEGKTVRIGSIADVKMIEGNQNALYSSGEIGDITGSKLLARSQYGLYNTGTIGSIAGKTEVRANQDYGVYNRGAIQHMEDITIQSDGAAAKGMGIYNAISGVITDIKNATITANYGIYNNGSSCSIASVEACTVKSGAGVGIYNNNGSVTQIKETAITAANGIVVMGAAGKITAISGGEISASAGGIIAQRNGAIERIDGVAVTASGSGIRATGEKSNIGALLGNRVQAGADAVEITAGASVNTIVSGVYIGGVNGVNNQGILHTIDSKAGETLVFYGKTGYAIDNANEQGGIIVEPILETDLPFQGYARYLGAKGQFAQPETFPMYTPENVRYHMSTSTEPVAGIAGAAFHYLIVDENRKFTITYDLNGGTLAGQAGPIRETYPFGADISLREAPEKAGYAFDYWKGSSYQPGDPYRVKGDHTFTAQWKPRAAAPQTGDHDHPVLWLAILALSTAGIAAVRLGRRRRASR